jgi:hypothetical protein
MDQPAYELRMVTIFLPGIDGFGLDLAMGYTGNTHFAIASSAYHKHYAYFRRYSRQC